MSEIFAVQSFIALVLNSALGIYVIRKNPGAPANRSFALLMLTFVIWDVSEGVLRLSSDSSDTVFLRFWVNVEWIGIALISGAVLHFILSYPRKRAVLEKPYAYLLIYGPPLVIIGLIWTTDLVVSGVAMGRMGYDAEVNTAGYALPAIVYTVQIFLALAILVNTYAHSAGIVRNRSKILLMGIAVPIVAGSVTEVFLPFAVDIQTRLGMGTIYTLVMGIFIAYAITKYKLLVIEPTTEEVAVGKPAYVLELDHNYLLKGESSSPAYEAFRDMVTQTPGLCITTTYPGKIKKRFGMEKTPIVWLSTLPGMERTLKPSDLDFEITQTIMKFVKENRETSVLIDDLEYLNEVVGFQGTSKFIKRVSDIVAAENSTLVVPVNPVAFDEREFAIIEKCFDFVSDTESADSEAERAISNAVLYLDRQEECYQRFVENRTKKLHIGTTYPPKIERKYSPAGCEYIWLTEARGGSDPTQLNYEVLRKLSRFLERYPGGAILFEGIEFLVSQIGFTAVLSFLQSAIDLVSRQGSTLCVPLNTDALSDRQLAVLEKRFDLVE